MVLEIEFGLVEVFSFVIGSLIGIYLENTNLREYKKRKMILTVVTVLVGGTISSYSLDEFFNVSSISLVTFWIGILVGYFITRTRKELARSKLELFRGFGKAGTSKG